MTKQLNGVAPTNTNNTDITPSMEQNNNVVDECYDGVTPTAQDILMGRGNSHKNHPGNVIFQGTINKSMTNSSKLDICTVSI